MKKYLAIAIIFAFIGGLFGSLVTLRYLSASPLQNIVKKEVVELSEESAVVDVVNKVSPAVVSISVQKDISQSNQIDPFFQGWPWFYYEQQPENTEPDWQKVGGGTGFIISSDGYILTNKHVVSDADAKYFVVLNDGQEYEAQIIGTDLFNDIGVLKIEAKDLPVVDLGDSDELVIGQKVVAIGNALAEFSNTVTVGVVSGIGRSIVASDRQGSSEKLEDVIQTDAAINPGNSGGPLLNLAGQVVGINTAVSEQGQSIGFAIPINSAKSVIDSILASGEIVRPYLGVRYMMLTASIAKANNMDIDHGALVVRGDTPADLAIIPGSPADKAGIIENDIILAVNGQDLNNDYHLAKAISGFRPGDEITLKVWSKGSTKEVKVVLEQYKN